jgi:hypothetical protein
MFHQGCVANTASDDYFVPSRYPCRLNKVSGNVLKVGRLGGDCHRVEHRTQEEDEPPASLLDRHRNNSLLKWMIVLRMDAVGEDSCDRLPAVFLRRPSRAISLSVGADIFTLDEKPLQAAPQHAAEGAAGAVHWRTSDNRRSPDAPPLP